MGSCLPLLSSFSRLTPVSFPFCVKLVTRPNKRHFISTIFLFCRTVGLHRHFVLTLCISLKISSHTRAPVFYQVMSLVRDSTLRLHRRSSTFIVFIGRDSLETLTNFEFGAIPSLSIVNFYTNRLERPRLSWSPLQRSPSSSKASASPMVQILWDGNEPSEQWLIWYIQKSPKFFTASCAPNRSIGLGAVEADPQQGA